MHRKILTIALAVLALAVAASPALGSTAHRTHHHKAPHRYSPKRGAKCRKGYRRVVRHRQTRKRRKVYCVKRAAKRHRKAKPRKHAATPATTAPMAPAPSTEKVKLHAHLDPTFTRDPSDPFTVTYSFSASASQQTLSADSVALGAEEPTPLPSGFLALFSDGLLECAINVGGSTTGSECPVTYQALGVHRVTTTYTSGDESATATEAETIEPLATETALSVSYTPESPVEVGVASGLYRIGALSITTSSSPSAVTARLGCGEGSIEHLTSSGCYQVESSVEYIYRQANGACTGGIWVSNAHPEPGESGGAGKVQGERFSAADLEAGTYHLRASIPGGGGYSGSEATAPLKFTPEATPDC